MRTGSGRARVLITRAEDVTGERWEDYADRVTDAGGEPLAIDLDPWLADGAVPAHDALLVTAGVDVDPARFGEERAEQVREVRSERDAFEAALIRSALERDIPLFCICRGHQVFNVALGGGLLQHLQEREPHRARRGEDGSIASGWHDVEITPGSLLHSIYGVERVHVNSRHHQAVTPDRVAPQLRVTGLTTEGETPVVEALEDPTRRWALGVQWHPERTEVVDGQVLFDAFVGAATPAR